jgi:uncharacterized protein DUF4395
VDVPSKAGFVRGQGFVAGDEASCGLRYPSLMFQPRVIGILVAIGLVTQWPGLFAALGILLAWNVLFPRWNVFDGLYAALVARPRGIAPPEPAPPPRRFAQGMASTFMLAIAFSLLAGYPIVAWIIEALLVIALAALIFGRFCLGSSIHNALARSLTCCRETR